MEYGEINGLDIISNETRSDIANLAISLCFYRITE